MKFPWSKQKKERRKERCIISIQAYVSQRQLDGLEALVKREKYPNRSEAIRVAIDNLIDGKNDKEK